MGIPNDPVSSGSHPKGSNRHPMNTDLKGKKNECINDDTP